ncbi:MAG: FAD-dependent oxidoreductase [Saprospiraceae bacterium]|nr:FAD-dependent oxidoreductase [Saprospiraceae bacterium]
MIIEPAAHSRKLSTKNIVTDLVVVGGGMAGVCCAITAARAGIKVVLVQDRPVLGGNASSEVRLWILGATSHMGNNNRWAREGGVIDEILLENLFRNREGNSLILDTILLEKVVEEGNITLLLNTAVYAVDKVTKDTISSVRAFCAQNSTEYHLTAPLFCDASGDGIVGFLSGAAFRMGAEAASEFNEPFAPSKEYGELLGHSIYFMSKDLGHPVRYVAPSYALKDITKIPRYRKFNVKEHGCFLWWIEYGGRLDTVHETETIKWELWKVVYGVWDYIKNSGNFPEAENLTLEWVGQIPGKRESRRFEGPYILKQADLVNQVKFKDAVAHGGWAIDLHPADGIFSEKPGCNQWHSKGVYEIPYRTMFSKNIDNLFLAGRIISCSHVAMASTRVMATCAHGAQAVGVAAAHCIKNNWVPKDLLWENRMEMFQQALLKTGQYIPHAHLNDSTDLMHSATITASSTLNLAELPANGDWQQLTFGSAQLIPLTAGQIPSFEIRANATKETTLRVRLMQSIKPFNFTPDVLIDSQDFSLQTGEQTTKIQFDKTLEFDSYVFLAFDKNEDISLQSSQCRISGLTTVYNKQNVAVSNYGRQDPDPSLGFESFEFWVPVRRPHGQNLALKIHPGLNNFNVGNITNGIFRPVIRANCFVAALNDENPELNIQWPKPQTITAFIFNFDPDWDHPLESSLWGHDESIVPFVIRNLEIRDGQNRTITSISGNHQTHCEIKLENSVKTNQLIIRLQKPEPHVPAAIFGLSIY